jgi:hypothetical protein
MLKIRFYLATILCLMALCVATERRAYAYIDPGSGLLILQNVGAALTGVLFFFRRRIKALFVRKNDDKTSS